MLALVGSGEYLPPIEPLDRELIGRLHGPARVVCLPTAAGTEGPERIAYWSRLGVDHFARLGAAAAAVPVIDRASADDPDLAAAIAGANFVYLSGGKPDYLYQTLAGSLAWEAIRSVLADGGLLAGCSAGAMILGEKFFGFPGWKSGFNFLPGATIIPHYDEIPQAMIRSMPRADRQRHHPARHRGEHRAGGQRGTVRSAGQRRGNRVDPSQQNAHHPRPAALLGEGPNDPVMTTTLRDKRYLLAAVGGLIVLFALLTLGAVRTTVTADEPTYVASGYGLLARGRAVYPLLTQRGYTPLLIATEALPLYLANPRIPVEQLAGWPNDYTAFAQAFRPYLLAPRMLLLARLPIIFLTLILAAVVFRWGKDLWGTKAGLLALGVAVFDPLLLAHGRLANSDAGTVALGTAALYATWRWRQKPAWRWALVTGVLLGLTMLSKASGVLWVAGSGLMVLMTILQQRRERRTLRRLGQWLVAGGVSLLILWAGYGFEWGIVRSFPLPVPAPTHWENLLYLNRYAEEYFALGLRKPGGWWWYFPAAFLIKNPLPMLIGLAIGLIVLLRRSATRSDVLILGLFPLLYTCAAILEGLNLGYRFMLPIHPFLYLVIGGGLALWMAQARRWALRPGWVVGTLGLWYVIATVRVFPYEIAYFNELVGGSDGGYRYLSDSNVDWGQASDVLQSYLQEHPETRYQSPAAKFHPAPGRYIVGASRLQGLGLSDPDTYEWFRHLEPQAILAHSTLVYDVPPDELNWVAQCEQPAPPLDDAAIAQGTGWDDLRLLTFDCTQTWVYPDDAASTGIYALHHALFAEPRLCLPSFRVCPPAPLDPFLARHLTQARLSFEQRTNRDELPAFALYEATEGSAVLPSSAAVYAAPTGIPSSDLTAAQPLPLPVRLKGPLALLGATVYPDNGTLEVETWWQVTDSPIERPFSIMGHLVSADGQTVEAVDGLGVSPAALAVGDVIVQRHRFSRPSTATGLSFLTGAYWSDTLERWEVESVPNTDSLLVPLDTPSR